MSEPTHISGRSWGPKHLLEYFEPFPAPVALVLAPDNPLPDGTANGKWDPLKGVSEYSKSDAEYAVPPHGLWVFKREGADYFPHLNDLANESEKALIVWSEREGRERKRVAILPLRGTFHFESQPRDASPRSLRTKQDKAEIEKTYKRIKSCLNKLPQSDKITNSLRATAEALVVRLEGILLSYDNRKSKTPELMDHSGSN